MFQKDLLDTASLTILIAPAAQHVCGLLLTTSLSSIIMQLTLETMSYEARQSLGGGMSGAVWNERVKLELVNQELSGMKE